MTDVVLWLSVKGLREMVTRNGFHYDCPLTSASWVVKPSWTLKQLTSTHKRLYTLSSSPSFLLLLLIVLSHLFPLYLPMLYNFFPHQLTICFLPSPPQCCSSSPFPCLVPSIFSHYLTVYYKSHSYIEMKSQWREIEIVIYKVTLQDIKLLCEPQWN